MVYTFVFITAFAALSVSGAYAFTVDVIPAEVKPGDVVLLQIEGDSGTAAKAEFLGRTVQFYPAAENRLFALLPVDIKTKPDKYPVSVLRDDRKETRSVFVRSHKFKTVKLTLPEGKVTLSPENQKRATNEAVMLKKVWSEKTGKSWDGAFIPPTETEISEVYGVNRIMNEKKNSVHRGMDFRGKTGTPVRAINSGTVVLTDDLFYGGHTVVVDHGMGLYSIYMHLSEFKALQDAAVEKNQVIGLIGSSGRVTGPHLHMSVKLDGVSINPEALFELELASSKREIAD